MHCNIHVAAFGRIDMPLHGLTVPNAENRRLVRWAIGRGVAGMILVVELIL